jgi:hypothetical protein
MYVRHRSPSAVWSPVPAFGPLNRSKRAASARLSKCLNCDIARAREEGSADRISSLAFVWDKAGKIIGTIGGISCHHCSETQSATRAPYDPYAFGFGAQSSTNGLQRRPRIAEPWCSADELPEMLNLRHQQLPQLRHRSARGKGRRLSRPASGGFVSVEEAEGHRDHRGHQLSSGRPMLPMTPMPSRSEQSSPDWSAATPQDPRSPGARLMSSRNAQPTARHEGEVVGGMSKKANAALPGSCSRTHSQPNPKEAYNRGWGLFCNFDQTRRAK